EGVFRQLALFHAPSNPMYRVRAVAGGRDIGSVLAGPAVPVPPYRYLFIIEKARDMVSTVIDLGGSLQAALESRDGEALALLENSQEQQILDLTTDIKKREFDIAQTTLEALNLSQDALQKNKQRYLDLINTGWISEENSAVAIKKAAASLRIFQGIAGALGEEAELVPMLTTG